MLWEDNMRSIEDVLERAVDVLEEERVGEFIDVMWEC